MPQPSAAKPAQPTHRWYERYPRALPIGVFVLTLGVTAISVAAVEHAEDGREQAQLSQYASAIASAVERNAGSSSTSLRAGAALLSTQPDFDPALYARFIDELGTEGRASGAEGLGWAMRLKTGESAPASGVQRIVSAPNQPAYTLPDTVRADHDRIVITFIRPLTPRNARAIGFDIASEPVRREAMMRAAVLGRPIVSGRVVLVQEGSQKGPPGFLEFMPVFGPGHDLRGFVYSPFNATVFVRSSVDLSRMPNVAVRIYDGDVSPANLLFERASGGEGRSQTRRLKIADRDWTLVVSTARQGGFSPVSLMTLLFGLLVATLLLVLARLVTQQASEDRLTLEWFEQQSSIRNSLVRELNHRVKNTLANVLSILALTRGRATDLASFADSLDGRIRALSATHDLLTQSDWGSTAIRALIEAEMAPYVRDQSASVILRGDDILLAPNDALSLGMAIHELATNAAKYGALSVEAGQVEIAWRMVTAQIAQIDWSEKGGPTLDPAAKRKRGFGTELIQKIVAHELRHPVDLKFDPDGVRCRLMVAVREVGEFAMREQKSA